MKFAIVLTLVAVSAYCSADSIPVMELDKLTPEQRAMVFEYANKCMKVLGLTPEDMRNVAQGRWDDKNKCIINCIMEEAKLIKNGVPQTEAIKENLKRNIPIKKVEGIMAECNSLRGASNCETGLKIYKCYAEKGGPFGKTLN